MRAIIIESDDDEGDSVDSLPNIDAGLNTTTIASGGRAANLKQPKPTTKLQLIKAGEGLVIQSTDIKLEKKYKDKSSEKEESSSGKTRKSSDSSDVDSGKQSSSGGSSKKSGDYREKSRSSSSKSGSSSSSSSSRKKDSERERTKGSGDTKRRDSDRDRKSSSKHSSSSQRDRERRREKERNGNSHNKDKDQYEKDKSTLEKVKALSTDGMARIPRRPSSFLDALGSADPAAGGGGSTTTTAGESQIKKPPIKVKTSSFRSTGLLDPVSPKLQGIAGKRSISSSYGGLKLNEKYGGSGLSGQPTSSSSAGGGSSSILKRSESLDPSFKPNFKRPLDDSNPSSLLLNNEANDDGGGGGGEKRFKSTTSSLPLSSDRPGGVKLISPKRREYGGKGVRGGGLCVLAYVCVCVHTLSSRYGSAIGWPAITLL